MSNTAPTPPENLPASVVDHVEACSIEELRALSEYADDLAAYRAATVPSDAGQDGENRREDRPEGVPSKATVTVKEINDNRYYYWQWREGDSIKSKYKGPVDGSE